MVAGKQLPEQPSKLSTLPLGVVDLVAGTQGAEAVLEASLLAGWRLQLEAHTTL